MNKKELQQAIIQTNMGYTKSKLNKFYKKREDYMVSIYKLLYYSIYYLLHIVCVYTSK
jgi:hypothetical protein